jgi:hypothetical protein
MYYDQHKKGKETKTIATISFEKLITLTNILKNDKYNVQARIFPTKKLFKQRCMCKCVWFIKIQ